MLKARIITALCLAIVLVAVLYSGSYLAFAALMIVFFAGAMWELFRLFDNRYPVLYAAIVTIFFAVFIYLAPNSYFAPFAIFSVLAWFVFLAPSLGFSVPEKQSIKDYGFELLYGISIFSSFLAFLHLYRQSLILLLSALVLVHLADIGAYFAGRALGKHKLAPTISPGKTWEGAIGGWVAVIAVSIASVFIEGLKNSITVKLYQAHGWIIMILVVTVLVAMSILGDLLESRLKRRRGFKDSSNLLPGHGGVLDRLDSLIPVLPLTFLVQMWT